MRWHRTQKGEARTVRRYAWWPLVVGTEWVWLETVEEDQTFCREGSYDGPYSFWRVDERRTL